MRKWQTSSGNMQKWCSCTGISKDGVQLAGDTKSILLWNQIFDGAVSASFVYRRKWYVLS